MGSLAQVQPTNEQQCKSNPSTCAYSDTSCVLFVYFVLQHKVGSRWIMSYQDAQYILGGDFEHMYNWYSTSSKVQCGYRQGDCKERCLVLRACEPPFRKIVGGGDAPMLADTALPYTRQTQSRSSIPQHDMDGASNETPTVGDTTRNCSYSGQVAATHNLQFLVHFSLSLLTCQSRKLIWKETQAISDQAHVI